MTTAPNLLPVPVIRARDRRRRLFRWASILTCEAMLLSVACIYANASSMSEVSVPKEAISATVAQIDLVTNELQESKDELETIRQRIAIAHTVTQRPEWSIAVAMIAESGGGLVTLESLQLAPGGDRDSEGLIYRLALVGTAENQADLTTFVQRLKRVGVFSKVQVSETRHAQDAESRSRVRFTIESSLAEEGQR